MKFRLALIAAGVATAFPPVVAAHDAELLALPLTTQEKAYNRMQRQVKADLVHSRGYYGLGATVAVLDTGVMGTHAELRTQLAGTVMFDASTRTYVTQTDGNGHGTHVAGIVAGSTGTGYSYGIAPDAKILPVKVFSSSTWTASSTAVASGLRYTAAMSAVSVVNLSLGGSSPLGYAVEDALRANVAANKLVVVAAGNAGGAAPLWPARYARESWAKGQIIAVGAVDANNVIASFSNRAGDTAQWFIVAPGVNVLSSYNNGSYVYMSGTSMATPVVAGAAALLEGAWPQLSAAQVASILFQTATDLGAAGVDAIYGWGLLNADRAMQPVGTLSVPTSGTTRLAKAAASMNTSAASWSGLHAAAASGAFRGITTDDFNRDFQTDYSAGIRAPSREGVAALLAGAGRTLQITERLMQDGSRFLAAVDEPRPSNRLSGDAPARTLLASSAVLKFAGGNELAFATGSLAGSYFGLAETDASLANPYLSLAGSATQMALGLQRGPLRIKAGVLDAGLNAAMTSRPGTSTPTGGNAMVGEVNYLLGDDSMIGLQVADVAEGGSWLGATAGDAMALDRGHTRTVTAQASHRLSPDVVLAAQYSVGRTADASGAGLFAAAEGVRSAAFAIAFANRGAFVAEDRLAVTLSSPMRIASGSVQLRMPVAVTADGDAVFESRRVSLAGEGRELRLGVDYAMPLSATSSLSYAAALRHDVDHVAGEKEVQAGVVYRLAF